MSGFTFTPVVKREKRGARKKDKWEQLIEAITTFSASIPHTMKFTLDEKADEIIEWLEADQPDTKDIYYRTNVVRGDGNYTVEVKVLPQFSKTVQDLEYGVPGRGGNAPKPITFTSPEEIARVLSELQTERAVWEARGKIGPNPFSKAAEAKLLREGVIIRRGPIGERPALRYIESVIRTYKIVIRNNFSRDIRRIFKKSMKGL